MERPSPGGTLSDQCRFGATLLHGIRSASHGSRHVRCPFRKCSYRIYDEGIISWQRLVKLGPSATQRRFLIWEVNLGRRERLHVVFRLSIGDGVEKQPNGKESHCCCNDHAQKPMFGECRCGRLRLEPMNVSRTLVGKLSLILPLVGRRIPLFVAGDT